MGRPFSPSLILFSFSLHFLAPLPLPSPFFGSHCGPLPFLSSLSYFICKLRVLILEAGGVTSLLPIPVLKSDSVRTAAYRLLPMALALSALQMFVPEWKHEGPGLGCPALICCGLFHFSPRLEMGDNAKTRSCFSSRIKWLPLSTRLSKMRWKPKEIFDVVQLRKPSGGIEVGNAKVNGSIRGSLLAGVLPGLVFFLFCFFWCFFFMTNVP